MSHQKILEESREKLDSMECLAHALKVEDYPPKYSGVHQLNNDEILSELSASFSGCWSMINRNK